MALFDDQFLKRLEQRGQDIIEQATGVAGGVVSSQISRIGPQPIPSPVLPPPQPVDSGAQKMSLSLPILLVAVAGAVILLRR